MDTTTLRQHAREISQAVRQHRVLTGSHPRIGDRVHDLRDFDQILVVGTGKAGAAGAIVNGTTLERARSLNLDAPRPLDNNDACPFCDARGDLIRTAPHKCHGSPCRAHVMYPWKERS